MPKSSFAERLARQGRIRAVPRVTSGSREEIVLRPDRKAPDVITATLAMVARGTTMLKAKRAVERALSDGAAVIMLSHVEDAKVLSDELRSAGISVTFRSAADRDLKEHFSARLKALRARLDLSQEEFARAYNLETKTIQGWEIGKVPDHGNRHLIRMIEKDPVTIRRLVNEG